MINKKGPHFSPALNPVQGIRLFPPLINVGHWAVMSNYLIMLLFELLATNSTATVQLLVVL